MALDYQLFHQTDQVCFFLTDQVYYFFDRPGRNFGQTYFTRQTRYARFFYSQTRYTSFSFTARPIVHRENRFLRFSQIDQTSFFSLEFHQTHQSKTLHQRSQDQNNQTNVLSPPVQSFFFTRKIFKFSPCCFFGKHPKHLDKNRRKLNIANIQIDAELRQELHEWAEVAVTSVPTLGASRSGHPGQPGHPGQEMFFCDHFHISQITKL